MTAQRRFITSTCRICLTLASNAVMYDPLTEAPKVGAQITPPFLVPYLLSPTRPLHLRLVRSLDQSTHFRFRDRFTLCRREVQVQQWRPRPSPGPIGADSSASRNHSARRIPAPRARSSSKANSASLTFVQTDLVLGEGFIAHRLKRFSGETTRSPRIAQHRAAGPEAG